jgi:flagellar basal body P-ring formation protein FlgA
MNLLRGSNRPDNRARALLFTILVALTGSGEGAQSQDLDAVRSSVHRFVTEETRQLPGAVVVEVQAPDKRLQLSACTDLQPYVPPGMRLWGRTSVGVRCMGPDAWSMTLVVVVKVQGNAVFTARPVGRGHRIEDADIAVRPADLAQLPPGVLTEARQALGQVTGGALAAGLPVRADMLHGERVVQPGQTVRIVYRADGLQVTGEGKAVSAGAVGEEVAVRTANGRVIRGKITAAGEVEVR